MPSKLLGRKKNGVGVNNNKI